MNQCEIIKGTEKEFLNIFKQLCYNRSSWQVWADVMSVIACTLSNAADKSPERYEAREKEYVQCIKRLGSVELPAKLMGIIVMALENDPDQDFLGKIYMNLDLGSHWKGQFFTPYCVCSCMAEIIIGSQPMTELETKGYISVNDPTCGAGATLIAVANTLHRQGVNYQRDVIFVGQDIDRVVGLMCYIQLSLLGCPGYIAIANTITNPICGSVIAPHEKKDQEFWYTPFYFRTEWTGRRLMEMLGLNHQVNENKLQQITVKNEVGKGYFFFIGNELEDYYMGENNMNSSANLEEATAEEAIGDSACRESGCFQQGMSENAETRSAEKKLTYATGEEKLKAEQELILYSVKKQYKDLAKAQFGVIFDELIKKANEDEKFNAKVLQVHKSFTRCMKYCGNKAIGLRNLSDHEKEAVKKGVPIVTPVSSDLLSAWIYEYYDLDDKTDIEEEQRKSKMVKANLPAKGKKEREGQFSLF